ncbi:MAG: hypothetical protein K1X35_14670 [Caulobacteraceae bacterium]|nr:hypothetical protein [Caulobacteraceae bacterium]
MRELIETHLRPVLRAAVDRLVGDPRGSLLQLITALWALIVLAAAMVLLGVVALPGRQQTGPLPVVAGATPSGQVLELARALRFEDTEGEHAASLGDLSAVEPATRAFLDQQVCKANLSDARQRAARAWRVNQNPDLCGGVDAALARAPLNVALGPWLGLPLTILLLAVLVWPVVLVFQWLPRVRRAYHHLYASRHRLDRLGPGAP